MVDLSILYSITSLNKVNVSENVLQCTYTVKMAKVVFSLHYSTKTVPTCNRLKLTKQSLNTISDVFKYSTHKTTYCNLETVSIKLILNCVK